MDSMVHNNEAFEDALGYFGFSEAGLVTCSRNPVLRYLEKKFGVNV